MYHFRKEITPHKCKWYLTTYQIYLCTNQQQNLYHMLALSDCTSCLRFSCVNNTALTQTQTLLIKNLMIKNKYISHICTSELHASTNKCFVFTNLVIQEAQLNSEIGNKVTAILMFNKRKYKSFNRRSPTYCKYSPRHPKLAKQNLTKK